MRALSLFQPWAHCMVIGLKEIETRSWRTHHRGPLAIHAGKQPLDDAARELCNLIDDELADIDRSGEFDRNTLSYGAIIGVVEVIKCIRVEDIRRNLLIYDEEGKPYDTELEHELGDYSDCRWAWITENPRRLDQPIPFIGRQGLFNIPDSIIAPLVAELDFIPPEKREIDYLRSLR